MARKPVMTSEPATTAPTPPPADLLAKLRNAASLDEALTLLAPTRTTTTDIFEVNPDAQPPARRGAALKAYVVAVRLNKPFTIADVQAELPDVKTVAFQVKRLAKENIFKVVNTHETR